MFISLYRGHWYNFLGSRMQHSFAEKRCLRAELNRYPGAGRTVAVFLKSSGDGGPPPGKGAICENAYKDAEGPYLDPTVSFYHWTSASDIGSDAYYVVV